MLAYRAATFTGRSATHEIADLEDELTLDELLQAYSSLDLAGLRYHFGCRKVKMVVSEEVI
jgi:hypothetical protein